MKYLLIFTLLFGKAHSQTIIFKVSKGISVYSDHKRFTGDTVYIDLDLAPNKTYYFSFQDKKAPLGLQGYLYDTYLGLHYPVNVRDEYFEFTTNESPLSINRKRFYLRLVKCF